MLDVLAKTAVKEVTQRAGKETAQQGLEGIWKKGGGSFGKIYQSWNPEVQKAFEVDFEFPDKAAVARRADNKPEEVIEFGRNYHSAVLDNSQDGWDNTLGGISEISRTMQNEDFSGLQEIPQNLESTVRTNNRAPIEQMLDDIYTEGMDDAQIESFKNQSRFGGKGSITGTQRNILQMSPHHFGMDLELTGKVIGPEDGEVVKELNALDIWPGNHPKNFIGSYHDMSKRITDSQKSQIIALTGKSPKEVDKFLKNIPEGSTLGKKELSGKNEWKVMDMIQSLKEQKSRNWNSMLEGRAKVTDLELPEALIGVDHQDLIHGAINKLESRKNLIALAKTPKWAKYTPKQKAIIIAKVAREQQNIALNISNWRLKKIEKAMKAEGIEIKDWTDIQTWMIQNPQKAATLDWHKTAQVGSGMTGAQLTKDLPAKRAKLVAQVFNLEQVPNTTKLIKQAEKPSGILHSPTGRGDQAFDNVVKRLQEDPTQFDSSGMGPSFNVNQMRQE